MKRYVILISGRGSNMESLLDAGLPGLRRGDQQQARGRRPGLAAARGIATVRRSTIAALPAREDFDAALATEIERHAPDLVLLAGFMRILGEASCAASKAAC
jgi:phosphoribosylglycinamide formyltransferase-1